MLVVKTFSTPLGKPASVASCAKAKTDTRVSGDGFTHNVHPAANAAPDFRTAILISSAKCFHSATNELTRLESFKAPMPPPRQ